MKTTHFSCRMTFSRPIMLALEDLRKTFADSTKVTQLGEVSD